MVAVYLIKNLITKKRYVGATSDFPCRISIHFSSLRRNKHFNTGMQNDFNNYGESSFVCGILKTVKNGYFNLNTDEKKFIDKLKPEYNVRNIAPLISYPRLKKPKQIFA